ncbi:Integrase catalytic core protein [Phytophthora cinnamomi]|uniref:Integrase catalytic core protein n=1 Tax=Phytophthora cinnamomi TaxID=4785 RepID=UPI003559A38F|nr:Integrase catalytic core protein [Phytophthora cinnamomi]
MLSRETNVIVLDGHKKYDAWKQDLQLKLNEWGLMEFLEGTATLDPERVAIDPDYAFLFGERKTKSFSALSLSLSIKLREEFKGPIETQDPAALYTALKAHFERGKENPIYLKREFYSRMLAKHEPVQQYIDGLRAVRRRIADHQTHGVGQKQYCREFGRAGRRNSYRTLVLQLSEGADTRTESEEGSVADSQEQAGNEGSRDSSRYTGFMIQWELVL